MSNSWLSLSLIYVVLAIPAFLAIEFFAKNLAVKAEVFLVWYFAGNIVASFFFTGNQPKEFLPSWWKILAMVLIGLVIGGVANVSLFRALASAPNPGLPAAVSNMAALGVFLAAVVLTYYFPQYFDSVKVDVRVLLGIVLTLAGLWLVAVYGGGSAH